MKRRLLYVLHNHPVVRPGGAEVYALELYEAMRQSGHSEPVLVARMDQAGTNPVRHPGTPFSLVANDPNEHLLLTETALYDHFFESYSDKSLYSVSIADFLLTFQPDVVHFQHTRFIGYDVITLVRQAMPHVPIVYTLHDFMPICHREGQMVRTIREALCLEASPGRCSECFPQRSPQQFYLRERLIKSHLSHVDLFLAPSRFLLERYVDWGIPREKLRFEEYGRLPQPCIEASPEKRPRTKLGFFGQMSEFKGMDVLLPAMGILSERGQDAHLVVHGANIDVLPPEKRELVTQLLEANQANVTFAGDYSRADIPRLMSEIDWVVVPSRWWENSPLVIQEAFMHGRPVICGGVGGMAEKVIHGVSGLHFNVGNPVELARTIADAVATPGLWERLREGIPPVYGMDEHVSTLNEIYGELIARRASRKEPVALDAVG